MAYLKRSVPEIAKNYDVLEKIGEGLILMHAYACVCVCVCVCVRACVCVHVHVHVKQPCMGMGGMESIIFEGG